MANELRYLSNAFRLVDDHLYFSGERIPLREIEQVEVRTPWLDKVLFSSHFNKWERAYFVVYCAMLLVNIAVIRPYIETSEDRWLYLVVGAMQFVASLALLARPIKKTAIHHLVLTGHFGQKKILSSPDRTYLYTVADNIHGVISGRQNSIALSSQG